MIFIYFLVILWFGKRLGDKLGELVDNINQHSDFSDGFIFINYDKNTKETVIIVFDDGVTIPKNFEVNSIPFVNASGAIVMAMEGTSTKKEEGRGFGLSSTKKLIEQGFKGNIVIASENGIYKTDIPKSKLSRPIKGTFVCINFTDKGEGLNIYRYLS